MLYFAYRFISDHIAIDNCYYLLSLCKTLVKTKKYLCTNNIKIENNKFKTVCVKNRTCYYFDDIIKFKDFDYNNILIDENILIYNIPYKNLIGPKSLRIRFGKVD